jgi:hypothetical protein
VASIVLDHEGNRWVVTGVRDTPHDFAIYVGYPEGLVPRRDHVSSKAVILTAELKAHLEVHRRSRFDDMRLPLGKQTITRLRKELGHNRYDDAAAWWEARAGDLRSMTLEAFAAKHGCTVGATEAQRLKLFGKINRDQGWWLEESVRVAVTSDRPASEVARDLGISVGSIRRLRHTLKLRGHTITTDYRERIARSKRGKPAHPRTAAALRRAAKRRKPKSHRKHISEGLKRYWSEHEPLPRRPDQRAWEPKEDRQLGLTIDRVVARLLSRTIPAVRGRRRQLGIPASRHSALARSPKPRASKSSGDLQNGPQ